MLYSDIFLPEKYVEYIMSCPALSVSRNSLNMSYEKIVQAKHFERHVLCYIRIATGYRYTIRSTIFNFNKIVNDLDIDSNTPAS